MALSVRWHFSWSIITPYEASKSNADVLPEFPKSQLLPQCQAVFVCLQGMAEKVDTSQIGTPEFSQSMLKVLTQESYSQAAKSLSAKIRAHKRTPVQQAGGAGTSH